MADVLLAMSAWMRQHDSITSDGSTFSYHSIRFYCSGVEKGRATGSRKAREQEGGVLRLRAQAQGRYYLPYFCLAASPQSEGLCDQGLLRDCKTICVTVFLKQVLNLFYFTCVRFCLHVCVPCVYRLPTEIRKGYQILRMVVSHHMGARN